MSDISDEDEVMKTRKREGGPRKSIESDDDCDSHSDGSNASNESKENRMNPRALSSRGVKTSKRITRSVSKPRGPPSKSSSDTGSEESSDDSEGVKRKRKTSSRRKRKSADSPRSQSMSGAARNLIREPRESVMDRFLEVNGDSSMDGWINDDDEETEGSEDEISDTVMKEPIKPKFSDSPAELIGTSDDSSDGSSADSDHSKLPKKNLETDEGKRVAGKGSDEEDVSPTKKLKSQQNRIHSDESEDEKTRPIGSPIKSRGPEIIKKKGKRRTRRRVIVVPESQDLDSQQPGGDERRDEGSADDATESEEEEGEEESDLSDFVVSDKDEVSGEDNATPMFYPEVRDQTSSNLRMDQQQAFKVVMECMVNRALNDDFLTSQAFREDPGITEAFRKIFSPLNVVMNDLKSQAWNKAFAASLDYTDFRTSHTSYEGATCEACCRKDRYATVDARISGYRYDRSSLKPLPAEDVDSEREKDNPTNDLGIGEVRHTFHIGRFCEQRALLYSDVLHFKLSLLNSCKGKVNRGKLLELSTEEIVEELIVKDACWIDDQYRCYIATMKSAQVLIRKRSNLSKDEMY